jgi:hypothetical protein
MSSHQLFQKIEQRTFSAHHMLLRAASLAIAEAESTKIGEFNKCLSAMVMTSLAVEALVNVVGSRIITDDWDAFERLRPHEKIDMLVSRLEIPRDVDRSPWVVLQYLGEFRNQIAHAKPESVVKQRVLPEKGLANTAFEIPLSALEREITLGNAKRALAAVQELKGLLTDALPRDSRFGIFADMWEGSTTVHEPTNGK